MLGSAGEVSDRATFRKDLTGKRYGKLVVTGYSHNSGTSNGSYWHCKCDCGNAKVGCGTRLKVGTLQSCGCIPRGGKNYRAGRPIDDPSVKKFIEMIRYEIKIRGMSLQDTALLLEISRPHLSQLLSLRRSPALVTAIKIANKLGINLGELQK